MVRQREIVVDFFTAGKSAKDCLQHLTELYKDAALSRSQVYHIFEQLRAGHDGSDGRGQNRDPAVRTPANISKVSELISSDRRRTVRELAEMTGIPKTTVDRILVQDLQLKCVSARWVPHLLTDENRAERVRCARNFFRMMRSNPGFLDRIITADETWLHYTTPESKTQSKQWVPKDSRSPTKARMSRSAKKTMAIVFFDSQGLVYTHYVANGQTVNSECYCEVLDTLRAHIQRKRLASADVKRGWLLHHDNARPHVSAMTQQFLGQRGIQVVPHPPYSPDLAPADFCLFPEVKAAIAGSKFDCVQEVKCAWEGVTTPLYPSDFAEAFDKWVARWQRCLEREGDCVEK
jgi:histone-lysine N-methyltransferase SETMAR